MRRRQERDQNVGDGKRAIGSAALGEERVKSDAKKTTGQHCRSQWVPQSVRGQTDTN